VVAGDGRAKGPALAGAGEYRPGQRQGVGRVLTFPFGEAA